MRTTDPAIRKLQEKDPEFPKYDGNPEHFLAWFVAVEERKELRQLSDQAAIIFATEGWGCALCVLWLKAGERCP